MSTTPPGGDFDHLDELLLRDPASTYAELRSTCPVTVSHRYGGFTALSRYLDVRDAAHAVELLSSVAIAIPGEPGDSIPIMLDPPEHTSYRALLAAFFSPRRVQRLEPEIRARTSDLIGRFVGRGSCDISGELTELVPTQVLARLLGVPHSDVDRFTSWVRPLVFHPTVDAATATEASGELHQFLRELIVARRRERAAGEPADDIVGGLLDAQVDDRPLPTSTIVNIAVTLVFGGLGPTTFLMNGAVALLDRDRELRQGLIREPALRVGAIEEFLRYLSPVQSIGRVVVRGTSRFGPELSAGDRVLLLWGSANRDEAVFENAEVFDPSRAPNRHLAFGTGIHRCLGAHLARTELRIVLDGILDHLPDYRIVDSANIEWVTGHMAGITRLPLEFTPAGARRR